jgi:hypothetical protein
MKINKKIYLALLISASVYLIIEMSLGAKYYDYLEKSNITRTNLRNKVKFIIYFSIPNLLIQEIQFFV